MSKEKNDTDQLTFEKSEEEYGPNYQNHLMELYKFYAGTADAVSTRRQSANVFFLTLNTALKWTPCRGQNDVKISKIFKDRLTQL